MNFQSSYLFLKPELKLGSAVASRINKSASTMSALTKRRGFSIGSNKSSIEEKTEVIDANNTGDATKKDANRDTMIMKIKYPDDNGL